MKKKSKEDNLKGLYILLGIVFLTWFISMFIIRWKFNDWTLRGTFGDSFGAINSLFSGLALGGIIYTIFLQKKELSLQRQELRETREEFTIQNKTLRLQRFENTFFNLLSLHHQIVDSMDLDIQKEKKIGRNIRSIARSLNEPTQYDRIILKGRDVFKDKYEKLKIALGEKEDLASINSTYLKFYDSVQTDFGHYFRNLYRIIKLVDETEFHTHSELNTSPDATKYADRIAYSLPNHDTRYNYTSMVRSQLSDYELLWLFYNCLSPNGVEKFKPYVEKYSLLKNLPQDKLHSINMSSSYNEKAYKNK